MPLSTKGAYDWVSTAVALHEPVFTDGEGETGTTTGEEARELTAIAESVPGMVGSSVFSSFGSRPFNNW